MSLLLLFPSLGTGTSTTVTPTVTPPTQATVSNPFTYYAYDLLTGNPLGSLPIRAVKFGQQLNSAGQMSGTIDLQDPRVLTANPLACTTPDRTVIVVDYLGAPVWAGVVAQRSREMQASPSDRTYALAITCSELWSYFGQRVQAADYSAPPTSSIGAMTYWAAAQWDATLIAAQVFSDALSYSDSASITTGNPLGGLSILVNGAAPSAASPVVPSVDWVPFNYPLTSLQTVDQIIGQLAQQGLGVGFDFGVDISYASGPGSALRGTFNIAYPRRGRTTSQNKLLIDLTTARAYRFPEDGTQTANQVYEVGGGGAIVISQNANALSQGYPLLERVMSRSQVQSANIDALMTVMGRSDLATLSYAPVAPSITLGLTDAALPLGSFITGDDVQIILPKYANDGVTLFDPGFPAGLNQEWRIVAWQATVPDEGDATLQLTLNAPPTTALPVAPAV